MLPLCLGYSICHSYRSVHIWRNSEFWKILISHKKLIEIWQLTSSWILTALILLELEGLGWTPLKTVPSHGGAGGWKRRAGWLSSLMPQEEKGWGCVWEDGTTHRTCRSADRFSLQPKSVRAVLWTDKNSENRKMKCGVLILRRQKWNCSFDLVLWTSVRTPLPPN